MDLIIGNNRSWRETQSPPSGCSIILFRPSQRVFLQRVPTDLSRSNRFKYLYSRKNRETETWTRVSTLDVQKHLLHSSHPSITSRLIILSGVRLTHLCSLPLSQISTPFGFPSHPKALEQKSQKMATISIDDSLPTSSDERRTKVESRMAFVPYETKKKKDISCGNLYQSQEEVSSEILLNTSAWRREEVKWADPDLRLSLIRRKISERRSRG